MNFQLSAAARQVVPQAVQNADGSLKNWVVYAAAGVACAAVGGALYYTVKSSSARAPSGVRGSSPVRLPRKHDAASELTSTVVKVEAGSDLSSFSLAELKRRGNEEYKVKSYAAAVECYSAAINKANVMLKSTVGEKETERLRVDISACYQNRAAANEQLKRSDADIAEDCTRAIELNRNYPKAWSRRARAYERMRSFDRALLDCTCAILLSRGAEAQWVEFGERILQEYCTELAERLWSLKHRDKFGGSLNRLNETQKESENELLSADPKTTRTENPKTAAATKNLHSITLEQFLSHFSEDPVKDALRNGLPDILANTSLQAAFDNIEKGEAQASINDAQKFIEIFSNGTHNMDPYWIYLAHNLCGTVWLSLEAMDNADRELSKILAVSPEVLMHEGSAGGQGDSDAKQKWKRMLANAYVKKAAIVFSGHGAMENDNADVDEAFRYIQQAIATDPSASDSYVHRAQMYVAVQQYADALRSFEQALKIRPKDDKPLQAQAAFCRFRVAAEHSPPAQLGMHVENFKKRVNELDVIEGYQLLAQVYADLGAPAEALRTQSKCVELNPRAAGNYVQRAAHNLMLDNIDDARRDLKKAIELDPFLTQAYETLITLEARMGQFEAADKVIEESVPYLHSQQDFLLLLQPVEAARAHHAAMKELKGVINMPSVIGGPAPSTPLRGGAAAGGVPSMPGGATPFDISSLMSSQLE